MKRIIYLLAISCFLLISCHDDDRFSVENVVGNNTSIVGMWLREAGKEQMVYAFFEDGTGYEKTTDRRNNTVSVDGFINIIYVPVSPENLSRSLFTTSLIS